MAYNDPIGKAEAAYVALVSALTLTGTRDGEDIALEIHAGRETAERKAPFVACVVESGDETIKGTGIWTHTGFIEVATLIDETNASLHGTLCATVFDALVTDTIKADLKAAVSDYHVFDVTYRAPDSQNSGYTSTRLPFSVVHCCSSLT
jgi:hypothetical protein